MSSENVEEVTLILENFIQKYEITPSQLKNSKIAKTVGTLKKHDEFSIVKKDKKVNDLSKKLIESWKNLFKSPSTPTNTPTISQSSQPTSSQEKEEIVEVKPVTPKKSKIDDSLFKSTKDKMRDFVIKKLSNTLFSFEGTLDFKKDEESCIQLASEIEYNLFKHCGHQSSDSYYKSQYSNINFNLGDSSNPDFILNIFNGVIKVESLATMTAADMASDSLKNELERLELERVFENTVAKMDSSATDVLFYFSDLKDV
jgi:transcription elongation factor S-II